MGEAKKGRRASSGVSSKRGAGQSVTGPGGLWGGLVSAAVTERAVLAALGVRSAPDSWREGGTAGRRGAGEAGGRSGQPLSAPLPLTSGAGPAALGLCFSQCARRGIPSPGGASRPAAASLPALPVGSGGPGSRGGAAAMARRRGAEPRSRAPPSPRPLRGPLPGNGGGRAGRLQAAHLGAGPGRWLPRGSPPGARPSCRGVSPLLSRPRRVEAAAELRGGPAPALGRGDRVGRPSRVGKCWRRLLKVPAAGPRFSGAQPQARRAARARQAERTHGVNCVSLLHEQKRERWGGGGSR